MKASRKIGLTVALLAACAISPVSSHAFGLSGIGGKLGLTNPENLDGTVAFGGHLEFEERGSRWHLLPGLMYWSEDGISDLNPNFDVYYHFNPEGSMTPYLGGGAGLHMYDFEGSNDGETDLGVNLFGGLRFPMGASHLFVEGRYVASDLSQFALLGGATFHIR